MTHTVPEDKDINQYSTTDSDKDGYRWHEITRLRKGKRGYENAG
jgi:hypothetical protein